MNIIKKSIAVALALGFALPAMAATVSNPLFSNGQTTIDATGGTTVNGTFTLTVGAGEVVEYLRAQPDTYPFTDTSVGGTLGYQEGVYTNVPFSVKVPPNTGTYNVTEQGAGIYGGNRAINGGDNVVFGALNVGTVRVVAGGTTGSSVIPGSIDDLLAQISALKDIVAQLIASAHPAPASACVEFNQFSYLHFGMSGAAGLQNFLINHGQGGVITYGATGYFGNQTATAVSNFVSANHCN